MPSLIELLGYLASALIVLSLAMSSVVRLRVLSLIGALVFVVYGVLIHAWPVVATNVAVAAINIYYLIKELNPHKELGAVPIAHDTPYLEDFLRSHADEIQRTQPGFAGVTPDSKAWLLTRDGLPAGALIGHLEGSTLHIDLDYVLHSYRDSRLGQWLFSEGRGILRSAGITAVTSPGGDTPHERYLHRVGFEQTPTGYVKQL